MKTLALLLTLGCLSLGTTLQAQTNVTISLIMERAMDGDHSLYEKVVSGKASKDEAKRLLAMLEFMDDLEPPTGSESSWDKKTSDLIKAAKAATFGTRQGQMALQQAGNCKSCHSAHRD